MITEIRYLEACTAGHFNGSPYVVLAAPINPGMTWLELRESLEHDRYSSGFSIEDWSGFDEALQTRFDGIADLSAPIDLIDHDEMARKWKKARVDESSPTIRFLVEGEILETVYAYFALVGAFWRTPT